MERAEKIGLGMAVAGHLALFGVLSLNLLSPDKPKIGAEDGTIGVTLAGDTANLNEIPEPVAETELAEPELPETPPIDEFAENLPEDSALPPPPDTSEPPPDRAAEQKRLREEEARKRREADAKKKRDTDAKKKRDADAKKKRDADAKKKRDAEARRRAMEESNRKIKAANAGRVKGEVKALIGNQVKPYLRGCTPSGVDVRLLITNVTLKLNRNGSLSGVTGVSQRGVNSNNRLQAKPMKDCVLGAIRRASPFSGLDAEYYDVWKSHRTAFKGR